MSSMDTFGKTIRLFLVEGVVTGLTTVELSNWTGIGVRVPRIKIKNYKDRAEFTKPGVYILVGKGENDEDVAYLGEAENVYERLLQHIRKGDDFWNEAIFFGSKDKYLNKASVKFLENKMHELAKSVGRYRLNQNVPSLTHLSEAEQAELDEFFSNIKLLTSTLGHKIFENLTETIASGKKEQILYCRSRAGANSTGSPSTEGFLVYKGSLLIAKEQPSLALGIRRERQKMIKDHTLKREGKFYRLTKDYVFTSSSRAASATLGRTAPGPLEWKTTKGISLKQLEQ